MFSDAKKFDSSKQIGSLGWGYFEVLREYDPVTFDPTYGPRWSLLAGHMQAGRIQFDRWRRTIKFPAATARLLFFVWCESSFFLDGSYTASFWPNSNFNPSTVSIYTNVHTLTLSNFVPVGAVNRKFHVRLLLANRSSSSGHNLNILGNESTARVLIVGL